MSSTDATEPGSSARWARVSTAACSPWRSTSASRWRSRRRKLRHRRHPNPSPRHNPPSASAGDSFGEIKINLNWNRGNDQRKGLLGGLFGAKGVDLDLGCLFELNGNQKGGVQALGNAFGNFHQPPYIELKGDDRTGSVAGGEWMRINGGHWNDIRRILVFAFIYEGIPNWAQTDGVVTLYVPEQPPIEIPMSEGSNRLGMCAVALLENIGGSVQVSRENRYFSGHRDMDRAYNWGLAYQAGSK